MLIIKTDLMIFCMGIPLSRHCVAQLEKYYSGGFREPADKIVDKALNAALRMLPTCNQKCGRTLVTTFHLECWRPFPPFAYIPVASKLLFPSHLPFACPLFLGTREGWDDYHSRKVKGQQCFSSGRLISRPWLSLFKAFSLMQNRHNSLAVKKHALGSFSCWFVLEEMVWKRGKLLTNPAYSVPNITT